MPKDRLSKEQVQDAFRLLGLDNEAERRRLLDLKRQSAKKASKVARQEKADNVTAEDENEGRVHA